MSISNASARTWSRSPSLTESQLTSSRARLRCRSPRTSIYFSGGDPNYLYQTMSGSRVWEAAQKAFARGAAYAGCSAGAMILGKLMPDFRRAGFGALPAFGIVPAAFILPHFDAIPIVRQPLVFALQRQLKDGESLLGVDEETALIGTLGGREAWRVHGRQTVSLFSRNEKRVYAVGEEVTF